MKSVYVVGGDRLIEAMFIARGWEIAKTGEWEDADLVCFTGGADVSPELYGEKNFASYNQRERDNLERLVYHDCLELDLPMVGICRGGQFLNVMNGGKMFQHVESHAIGGTHPIIDLGTGDTIQVTSTHHQMMRPNYDTAEVLAIANLGGIKQSWDGAKVVTTRDENDTEVVWYEDTKSLCFQPHPEYGVKSCEEYFFKLLEEKFNAGI